MQVTLNIDTNIAGSVAEVFAALTVDDKRRIAMGVMEKFIAEPHKAEREAYEVSVIIELQESGREIYVNYGRKAAKDCSFAQIRSSTEFRERMTHYKSTRETMLEEIIKATVTTYRETVTKLVQSDPQIQAVLETVLSQIRADFPKNVHDAMAAWFVIGMTNMQTSLIQALTQSQNNENFSKDLLQRLQLHS